MKGLKQQQRTNGAKNFQPPPKGCFELHGLSSSMLKRSGCSEGGVTSSTFCVMAAFSINFSLWHGRGLGITQKWCCKGHSCYHDSPFARDGRNGRHGSSHW